MTEKTDISERMHPAIERFVLHWGDMGGQWGVNRSVSQIHALLYVSPAPLTADDIAGKLGMARSNVSTSIKELQSWELIRRVPMRGERREHYEAETDVWEMLIRIAKGRKVREIDPVLTALRSAIADADADPSIDPVAAQRLRAMYQFTQTLDAWYLQMMTVPKAKLAGAMRLGARIFAFLPASKTK